MILEQCAKRVTSPKPWSSVIMLPYPSSHLTSVTMPAAGASVSAPLGPGLLHGRVGRREPRQQPQLLLALAEAVQRVAQPGHALAHLLDLVGEHAVLVLERAAAGDVHAARDGGDAQHQERQRYHA